MGALHAGHGTVIRAASAMGPVLVSVFVNPLQFGPDEDLARYPRSLESDLALAERWGAAALWAPSAEQIYPQGGGASSTNDSSSAWSAEAPLWSGATGTLRWGRDGCGQIVGSGSSAPALAW